MKKQYKQMYKQSKKPIILETENQKIVYIMGCGDPNTSQEFQKHIEKLYKFSYAIRMSYKKEPIAGYYTYNVGPLEGIWTTTDQLEYTGDKSKLKYKLLIVQPDFVTEAVFNLYKQQLGEFGEELEYEVLEEGTVGQIMHVGSYDLEPETIKILEEFVSKNGYELVKNTHHEIYLSDFRKTAKENLKTIIRYSLK